MATGGGREMVDDGMESVGATAGCGAGLGAGDGMASVVERQVFIPPSTTLRAFS